MQTDIRKPGSPAGLAPANGYALVERNIHLTGGKYRVLITRRPKNLYGGRFAELSEAIRVRDELEQTVAPRKPWGIRGRMVEVRRTTQQARMELRAAGLCQICGDEPPKAGCVTCQSCLTWSAEKRRAARREAPNDGSELPAPRQ
jgi:hypothetical protein